MMKRKLSLIACLIAGALVIASCSSGSTTSAGEAAPAGQQTEQENSEEGDTGKSVELQSDETADAGNTTQEERLAPSKDTEEVTLNETTIYDNDGITAVVTGLSDDSYGKNVEISITNNSDKDISWGVEYAIVDDITMICATTYDIQAGKAGTAEYTIEKSQLERYGVKDIHTLQLICNIMDSGTYESIDYCISERLVTSLGQEFDLTLPVDEWTLACESESVKLYYTGTVEEADEYEDFKTKAVFVCYNDSDSYISIAPEDVSFDGEMDYNNAFTFAVGPKSYGEVYLACGDDAAGKGQVSFSVNVQDGKTFESRDKIDDISVSLK